MNRALMVFLVCHACLSVCHAHDLPAQGPVYAIQEPHAGRVWLEDKKKEFVESGKEKEMQAQFKAKAKYRIENPNGGRDLPRAVEYTKSIISMDAEVPRDIKDHTGRVIFKRGTRDNALKYMPDLGLALLYIDGRDKAQVAWALLEVTKYARGKITLTAGKPLVLSREHDTWFYFEQTGAHIKRFKITALPAKVGTGSV